MPPPPPPPNPPGPPPIRKPCVELAEREKELLISDGFSETSFCARCFSTFSYM